MGKDWNQESLEKAMKFVGDNIVRIKFEDEELLDFLIGKRYKVIAYSGYGDNRIYLEKPERTEP